VQDDKQFALAVQRTHARLHSITLVPREELLGVHLTDANAFEEVLEGRICEKYVAKSAVAIRRVVCYALELDPPKALCGSIPSTEPVGVSNFAHKSERPRPSNTDVLRVRRPSRRIVLVWRRNFHRLLPRQLTLRFYRETVGSNRLFGVTCLTYSPLIAAISSTST
jgi:hypothetical protein